MIIPKQESSSSTSTSSTTTSSSSKAKAPAAPGKQATTQASPLKLKKGSKMAVSLSLLHLHCPVCLFGRRWSFADSTITIICCSSRHITVDNNLTNNNLTNHKNTPSKPSEHRQLVPTSRIPSPADQAGSEGCGRDRGFTCERERSERECQCE